MFCLLMPANISTSIAENDYNLNIPRYVDTFEAEDRIDIDVLASEIVELDKLMG
jgi:type I restriction enzyme M protein